MHQIQYSNKTITEIKIEASDLQNYDITVSISLGKYEEMLEKLQEYNNAKKLEKQLSSIGYKAKYEECLYSLNYFKKITMTLKSN